MFSREETQRYARQLVLKGFGGAAQQKLKAARVLVIGAGGLGSPVAAYLAAAGVGTLGIADDDHVSLSNLQRQIVHNTADLGRPKVESAAGFLSRLNPHVTLEPNPVRIRPENGPALVSEYDLVLDGSDSLATRRAVAAATIATRRPLVSGGVSMFDGQVTVFVPGGPEFTAIYPEAASESDMPSCEVTGVLGALTGVIGTLMAMEAIKLITGIGEPLIGRLLLYDGKAARFTEVEYA